jgi:DNA-binding CsgD family transcriptional regulator
MAFEAALFEAAKPPIYLQVAERAAALRGLGLAISRIAESLGVSEKTVSKALLSRLAVADE